MHSTFPRRSARLVSFGIELLLPPSGVHGAELELRESLLLQQRDRVTITITAVVDEIGERAHSLGDTSSEDCDLHVPLRTREIRVPVLGELKNACSMKPPNTLLSYWSDRLYEETHGLALPVTGVFRIWPEHPPGAGVQAESARVGWYRDSNPDHQVALHPLTRVGELDFLAHVKMIEDETQVFEGYGPKKLNKVLGKELTMQRIDVGGEPVVRLSVPKTAYNHWSLRARVAGQPLIQGLLQERERSVGDIGRRARLSAVGAKCA